MINAIAKIIVGWILLIAGLAVIGGTIDYSYQYFTAKADFPALFKLPAISQSANPVTGQSTVPSSPADAQAQMQQSISQATNQALSNMIPPDSVVKLLDIIAWSIFATFLIYAGGKICGIGIQLLSSKNS